MTVDNSKATGTFTYVSMDAGGAFTVDYGTITFDGAGHGIFSSLTSTQTGTIVYTVTVPDNTLTIDSTTIGTLNKAGNFFTAIDINNGGKFLLTGVKKAAVFTETSVTYVGGQFQHDTATHGELFSMTTATPPGVISYTNLTSGGTGTMGYILASNGTFTVPAVNPDKFGAISEDKNIMIFGDAELSVSPIQSAACALKLPGSGMTIASLNGTYMVYAIVDNNASAGPDFSFDRLRLTFAGNGNGTYTLLASSRGPLVDSGTFTYTVNSDGTFLIGPEWQGVALQDGSVISFFDDDTIDSDNIIQSMIGIKQ